MEGHTGGRTPLPAALAIKRIVIMRAFAQRTIFQPLHLRSFRPTRGFRGQAEPRRSFMFGIVPKNKQKLGSMYRTRGTESQTPHRYDLLCSQK
jgi:hypothetical protein